MSEKNSLKISPAFCNALWRLGLVKVEGSLTITRFFPSFKLIPAADEPGSRLIT